MSATSVCRQVHRWASLVFSLIVAGIFATLAIGAPPEWADYLPLAPLAVMVPTGLWLFAVPYLGRRRA